MKTFLAALLMVCFTASGLSAHELWLEKGEGTYSVLYGHRAEDGHGTEIIPYKPEEVLEIKCFDHNGRETAVDIQKETPVTMQGNCAAVNTVFSSGYWTKTPKGTKNIAKDQAGTPIYSWYSLESAKRIDAWSKALERPLTDSLEIVPRNNPLALKKGAKLRLRVFFKGQPLENAVVTYDGKPRGATDREGRVNLRIKHAGFQMISTSHKEKNSSPKADDTIYSTNLIFEAQ